MITALLLVVLAVVVFKIDEGDGWGFALASLLIVVASATMIASWFGVDLLATQ